MLVERLVFGCGHLTGGATRREAARIVTHCLDAGVIRFDTAPNYGLGTTEATLGQILSADGRVAVISAKVGSRRPSFGYSKSFLRALKRSVRGPRGLVERAARPRQPDDPSLDRGEFRRDEMLRSVERSLKDLRRDQVDVLLLHEAYADNLSGEVFDLMLGFKKGGRAAEIGIANSASFSERSLSNLSCDFVLQVAVSPDMFGIRASEREGLYLHSIIRTFGWLRLNYPQFEKAARRCQELFPQVFETDHDLTVVLPYCLLSAKQPKVKTHLCDFGTGAIVALFRPS